jgi:hypothetical protein
VAFSGPEGKCHGAACPDVGAPDEGFVWDGCACREGDRQGWEIDAGVGCVAWFDRSGIAFNEVRLFVDMQIVDRQSSVPPEVFTDAGNVFAVLGGDRRSTAPPLNRPPRTRLVLMCVRR